MSDEIKFEPFEIDLDDNGGVFKFTSQSDLESHIVQEIEFWSNFKPSRTSRSELNSRIESVVAKQLFEPLSQLRNTARSFANANVSVEEVRSKFNDVFRTRSLPHSSTFEAESILRIQSELGIHVGMAALITACGISLSQEYLFNETFLLG